jgi:methionyl-tRNA formyltransferase
MPAKIIFFGNERLATGVSSTAPTLQALIGAGYEVAALVVAQNEAGASRKARKLEVAAVAEQYSIPVLAPDKLGEAADELKEFGADIGVLVAYGKIVPNEIIDMFPHGILNIHPSLLPKHRGSTPIESVILSGTTETGVSLMQLGQKMDAGPVYAQETVLLRGDETKQQLADQLLGLGKDMLLTYLPQILEDRIKPQDQDEKNATVDGRISKADAVLDFTQKTAEELAREVRAYAGWPRSRVMIGTTEAIITSAHAEDVSGVAGALWIDAKKLGFFCRQGVLVIDSLIPAGKKEMPASAFLAGYTP